MKRRDFLAGTAPLLAAGVVVNGRAVRAMANPRGWWGRVLSVQPNDRVLVVIQLEGGNDGLNMVVPIEDDAYYTMRPGIGVAKADAVRLDNTPLLGLNPKATGLAAMYNQGTLAIVQNVGYANNTMSHFAGTEIWNTASGGQQKDLQRTGWLGRYLHHEYPLYPDQIPSDPPAIEIGAATSAAFTIVGSSISMSLLNPSEFYDLVNGGPQVDTGAGGDTPSGHEKAFVDLIDQQSRAYAESIRRAASRANNIAAYPDGNVLAESLAIVARLIAGGLATRVYKVTLGGFDTHANQKGYHDTLLGTMSDAIKAFAGDLKALQVDERVVGMTYSEFGRRVRENASGGTDHGAAAPHLVFGTAVNGGTVFGGEPNLVDLDIAEEGGNLRYQVDFHCYYASVLAPWFGLADDVVRDVLPIGVCDRADYLNLYRTAGIGSAGDPAAGGRALNVYPSPASRSALVTATLPRAERIGITLFDDAGHRLRQIAAADAAAGTASFRVDVSGLPSGNYLVTLDGERGRLVARLVVMH
ncbi:MAG TPA: DUF1501 domain-containing protein [Candidatus Kapabacteria bacterium]|nr:DUF1501 domain-containing protein [Candidatus Kapabacteria bacterium]